MTERPPSALTDDEAIQLCPECPRCGYPRKTGDPSLPCSECGLEIPRGSVVLFGTSLIAFSPILRFTPFAIYILIGMRNTGNLGPVPDALLIVLCIGMTVVFVRRIRKMRSWSERHALFVRPGEFSVHEAGQALRFQPMSSYRRVTFGRHRKWRLAWTKPDPNTSWLLRFVGSGPGPKQHVTFKGNEGYDRLTRFVWKASPEDASKTFRAVESLFNSTRHVTPTPSDADG